MKYEAFLSYARVPDLALATALERSLQSFAKPWNRVRAVDVIRDQADLSSIGGLARGVTRAIDESGFLIVLACPESAGSYWVRQELTHWLGNEIHREGRVRTYRRNRALGSRHRGLRLGVDHRLS